MSTSVREAIEGHQSIAQRIQSFCWEGKPFKSKRIERTAQEYDEFLESIRQDCWNRYDSGAEELGWK